MMTSVVVQGLRHSDMGRWFGSFGHGATSGGSSVIRPEVDSSVTYVSVYNLVNDETDLTVYTAELWRWKSEWSLASAESRPAASNLP